MDAIQFKSSKGLLLAIAICAFAGLHVTAAEGNAKVPPAAEGDLTKYVDVFTGTAGTGHTHPAAEVPFGMVQAGPDTGRFKWEYCSGYQFKDTSVLGYSQTHLSGTGCLDYGDVSVLPFTGETRPLPMSSAIDKKSETATTGYYRVVQPKDGVEVGG